MLNRKIFPKAKIDDRHGGFWLIEISPIRTVAFVRRKVKNQKAYQRYLGSMPERTPKRWYQNPKITWDGMSGRPPAEIVQIAEDMLKKVYVNMGWDKDPP